MLRAELRDAFKSLADLERLTNRIIAGYAQPRDIVALRGTLEKLPEIVNSLKTDPGPELPLPTIELCSNELATVQAAVADEPPATLQNTGAIRPGYSQELELGHRGIPARRETGLPILNP